MTLVSQEIQHDGEWRQILSASQVLDFEVKFSNNNLKFSPIVWANKHFKNFVYGKQFQVFDHKISMSVLKLNRRNEAFPRWLTRWVDRLPPFDFEEVHTAKRT